MFTVREVDIAAELPRLADVFNRGFNVAIPRSRFDWLYRDNPDGPTTAWFVVDDRSGEVAGCTAVFPRRIQVRGLRADTVAWNCGDFCIMPRYRTGAAAITLRRAARDGVDAGVKPFLYAHPNDRMLPIHMRVGHRPLGKMVRLARPIRMGSSGVAAQVGTAALRVVRPERVLGRRDQTQVTRGPLPAELDDLFARVRLQLGTALVRDVRYLTWRFVDCPLGEYRFILTSRGSQLTGYLVFGISDELLLVKDWIGVDDRAVRTLFGAAIDEACTTDVTSVSVTLLETHRDRPLLRRLGFAQRAETSTSITYAPDTLPWRAAVMSSDAWYMTVGDRDV